MNNLSRLALAATFLGFTGAAAAASMETVLYSFKGSQHRDGSSPQSDLIADAAGNLYGTTQTGGKRGGSGAGTIFELSPTGNRTSGPKRSSTISRTVAMAAVRSAVFCWMRKARCTEPPRTVAP